MKDSKGEEAEEPGGERESREKSEKDSEDRGQFAFCFIFASWHTCEMHLGDSDRVKFYCVDESGANVDPLQDASSRILTKRERRKSGRTV